MLFDCKYSTFLLPSLVTFCSNLKANGPLDIGDLLKSCSRKFDGLTSFNICLGIIGNVKAWTNGEYDDGKINFTESSDTFSNFIDFQPDISAPTSGFANSFNVKITSSAVRSCPSDHFKPFFNLTVYSVSLSFTLTLSAMSAFILPVESYRYKLENSNFAADFSALVFAKIGFKFSKGPNTPSEYDPPEVYAIVVKELREICHCTALAPIITNTRIIQTETRRRTLDKRSNLDVTNLCAWRKLPFSILRRRLLTSLLETFSRAKRFHDELSELKSILLFLQSRQNHTCQNR